MDIIVIKIPWVCRRISGSNHNSSTSPTHSKGLSNCFAFHCKKCIVFLNYELVQVFNNQWKQSSMQGDVKKTYKYWWSPMYAGLTYDFLTLWWYIFSRHILQILHFHLFPGYLFVSLAGQQHRGASSRQPCNREGQQPIRFPPFWFSLSVINCLGCSTHYNKRSFMLAYIAQL